MRLKHAGFTLLELVVTATVLLIHSTIPFGDFEATHPCD